MTANAVTTTYTYEPQFFQLATVTDPLNHTWTIGYDALGRPTSATDPLTHQTTLAYNAAAQVTSMTDPLSHTWLFGYTDGDFTSTTNPLGSVATQFVDDAGRRISATDPLGRVTRTVFDRINRVTSTTDPLAGPDDVQLRREQKPAVADRRPEHSPATRTIRAIASTTRTDPLTHAASYGYDLNGNLTQGTDRKAR